MKTLTIFSLMFLAVLPAAGADRELAVTVYNQDFAVVKDTRIFDLPDGIGELKFTDVAEKIDPTSVQITNRDEPNFVVREQNYENNLVSSSQLLKEFLDRPITAILDDGRSMTGQLLSTDNGVILKTNEGIKIVSGGEKGHLAQIQLSELPKDLLLRPTLVWQTTNPKAGKEKIEIAYQTSGFNWNANYNAMIHPESQTMDINGWVTINNTSGATYPDAKLKLVAGEVHKVKEEMMEDNMAGLGGRVMMAKEAAAPPGFEERTFAEYHLYDLGRSTTLANNETKQIEFFNVRDVAYTTQYLFDTAAISMNQSDLGEEEFENLDFVATFENKKENKLGIPLPKGDFRVYQQDSQQADHLVGTESIEHTPKDEKVRLTIGEAFDVVGSKKILSQDRMNDNEFTMDIRIRIRNHKSTPIPVVVRDRLMGYMNWDIEDNTVEFKKIDFQTAEFSLTVPANGQQDIQYRVRYTRYNW
jgi:hypothetical protein